MRWFVCLAVLLRLGFTEYTACDRVVYDSSDGRGVDVWVTPADRHCLCVVACCSKIAEAEAAVSVNEKKWLMMHVHVQMRLDVGRYGGSFTLLPWCTLLHVGRISVRMVQHLFLICWLDRRCWLP